MPPINGATPPPACNCHFDATLATFFPPNYDDINAPTIRCADPSVPDTGASTTWLAGLPERISSAAGSQHQLGLHVDLRSTGMRRYLQDPPRTWTMIDWCMPTATVSTRCTIQIIKVLDEQGARAWNCPAEHDGIERDPFTCCATVDLPDVIIEDACSRINNISGDGGHFDPYTGEQTGMLTFLAAADELPGQQLWDRDTMGAWGYTPLLASWAHTW